MNNDGLPSRAQPDIAPSPGFSLSIRKQICVAGILLFFIAVTRGQHFATIDTLPGASWAAFFLAGVYLRPRWVLPAMLGFVWFLDFAPYLFRGDELSALLSGGEIFCLTPAYLFLAPAYAALWAAGRWYAGRYRQRWQTLGTLALSVLAGSAVCELFSSGGFYFFSGRFADPTVVEFAARVLRYYPAYLQALFIYVGASVLVHSLLVFLASVRRQPAQRISHGR